MRNLIGEGERGGGAPRHHGQSSTVIVRSSGTPRQSEQTPAPRSNEIKPKGAQGAAEDADKRPLQSATAHWLRWLR